MKWFLPRCQNQIQGLFKDFQGTHEGYSRRTTLTKNSTFVRISKQCIFDNLTLQELTENWSRQKQSPDQRRRKQTESRGAWILVQSARNLKKIVTGWLHWQSLVQAHCFRKSHSSTFKDFQTKIQGLSRTMSVSKDFQGLENHGNKFKDFQGPSEPCNELSTSTEWTCTDMEMFSDGDWSVWMPTSITLSWQLHFSPISMRRSAESMRLQYLFNIFK